MRDDIHKRVPKPAVVQAWVKAARRQAEGVANNSMERLEKSVRQATREISQRFLEGLRRRMVGTDSELFGLAGVQTPRELGGSGSLLERQLLTECQATDRAGGTTDDQLCGAVANVLRDRALADIRAAEPVLLPVGGRYVIDHMRGDLAALGFEQIAREVLGGGAAQMKGETPISADENLLAPVQRR